MSRSAELHMKMDELREQVRVMGERHEGDLIQLQQILVVISTNNQVLMVFPNENGGLNVGCEKFFEYDNILEDAKVKIATIILEGKALKWHQAMMKSQLGWGLLN
ncbi:hypothetical protein HAX54_036183 [Datura stramonium]|uniref:Uncharacterized protein n=1 Tax=Datura stramonium TaxID=4076 RepID=A0ABS8SFV7_DATST|nr:hypothetical protein [Datura stramonium]